MKKYLTIVCDQDFEISIDVGFQESIDHSYLVFSQQSNTSCKANIKLNGPESKGNITILGITHNKHKVSIDGKIVIGPHGENASGHLQEDVLLLGSQAFAFTKPVLDIWNNNVSASHGAKVHSIDKQQLFYLNARGLNTEESKKIIVSGLIQKLFDDVDFENIHIIGKVPTLNTNQELIDYVLEQVITNNKHGTVNC